MHLETDLPWILDWISTSLTETSNTCKSAGTFNSTLLMLRLLHDSSTWECLGMYNQ